MLVGFHDAYNLHSSKTFLAPSLKDPLTKINVFMQPLIEELKVLCQGMETYDSHLNCRFKLRVAYMVNSWYVAIWNLVWAEYPW
jgi:hypothetical protein